MQELISAGAVPVLCLWGARSAESGLPMFVQPAGRPPGSAAGPAWCLAWRTEKEAARELLPCVPDLAPHLSPPACLPAQDAVRWEAERALEPLRRLPAALPQMLAEAMPVIPEVVAPGGSQVRPWLL